jgi:hypothetical protein
VTPLKRTTIRTPSIGAFGKCPNLSHPVPYETKETGNGSRKKDLPAQIVWDERKRK